jgi:hypothetical protein
MPFRDLPAEFEKRSPMRFGFGLRSGDFVLAVSDLGRSAITVIDRNYSLMRCS